MKNKYAIINEETADYIEENDEIVLFDTSHDAEMHAIDIAIRKPYITDMTEEDAKYLPGR